MGVNLGEGSDGFPREAHPGIDVKGLASSSDPQAGHWLVTQAGRAFEDVTCSFLC